MEKYPFKKKKKIVFEWIFPLTATAALGVEQCTASQACVKGYQKIK